MREVDIGESKALLVHQNGQFSAIGHKCTHYGAPLAKGYLGNGRVRCPWHGACFSVQSGDIEEFPGLDGVPCFQVLFMVPERENFQSVVRSMALKKLPVCNVIKEL